MSQNRTLIHQYVKTTVIRNVTRVFDDGSVCNYVYIDSDEPTRAHVVAILEQAKFFVLNNGGELYDKLDLFDLPEPIISEEEDEQN